jgi:4-methyl-5(b-hydroxyethyl)-thiazole monophosphate biosynthesis
MKLFVPLADGFEDIEALSIIDILRRADVAVDTVGVPGNMITSKSGVRLMVDRKLGEIKAEDYSGVILPGGGNGVENLSRSASLMDIITKLNDKGKMVAAICAAPSILAKIGILEERRATIYPGLERELPKPREDKVVVDGNIITSQGPGTAIDFSLKLVETLKGQSKAEQIRKSLLA